MSGVYTPSREQIRLAATAERMFGIKAKSAMLTPRGKDRLPVGGIREYERIHWNSDTIYRTG